MTGKARREKAWRDYIKAVEPVEGEFKKKVGKLFREQKAEVLSKIDEVVFDPDTQINIWMFGRKTWERRFRDVGRELIKVAVAVNGLRVMSELPVVGVTFDIRNPRAESWIKRKVFQFAYEVNNTTEKELRGALFEALRNPLVQAMERGDAVKAIQKEVKRIFGYAEGYRNERIARTETLSATNYGAQEAIMQSGIKCRKEWVATLDERTRDRHAEMDGETAELSQPFSNGLMFPGDPDGPPEEIINCRCTEVHIFEGEE